MQIKSVFELMSEVMTFRFPTFSILEHIRKSQRDSRLYVYLQLRGCHRNPWLVVIWEDFQISNTKRAPSLSRAVLVSGLRSIIVFGLLHKIKTLSNQNANGLLILQASHIPLSGNGASVTFEHNVTFTLGGWNTHMQPLKCAGPTAWTAFAFGAFLDKTDNSCIQ